MAIYLLNISVDTADRNPAHLPEDLTYNDQESIVEIVVEKILGFEQAFEEYDDPDNENQESNSTVKIELIQHFLSEGKLYPITFRCKQNTPIYQATFPIKGFHLLNSPPPEA